MHLFYNKHEVSLKQAWLYRTFPLFFKTRYCILYFLRLQSAQNKIVLKALAKNLDHPKFGTDTAAGIEAARRMINEQGRPEAPEIIVVITDGRSTNPRNTILQV